MQVKKAAEKAWEADKDKESACALRQIPRKPVIGSTKRVEQFRKNLRRWMTGNWSSKILYVLKALLGILHLTLSDNIPS